MNALELKNQQKTRRINRIRSKVRGTAVRPRLTLIISNQNVYAQLIDDESSSTLVSESSLSVKGAKSLTEKATAVGKAVGKKALSKKLSAVVFDRRGRQYHGRVKCFADAARSAGLEF